jgi:serine/threonine protein kinase/Tol biopolymer transport system component
MTADRTGSRLGVFEILGLTGTGGMGEVWRARDTKLQREVAIKLLPGRFASDPEHSVRFAREARALAALNHPNIAAIHDFQQAGDDSFLVLEFVGGETLADRLKRGPMPAEEVSRIVLQIAEALESAHEKGIVHRDLKPANIKITPEGRVKVLDFGLAKMFEPLSESDASLANSPTMMSGSVAGTILGTAAYMSPEQARGYNVDKRTDIWAFGCVVYEMLTGRAAFQGDTVSDILARILEREVDLEKLRGRAPARMIELIERCLQKDRAERVHDIADARIEIKRALASPVVPTEQPSRARGLHPAWIVSVGLLTAVALLALTQWRGRSSTVTSQPQSSLVSLMMPERLLTTGQPALSPDGRRVALGTTEGLWVRPIDSFEGKRIDAFSGEYPFWSPDGRSIGFSSRGKLRIVDASGGPSHAVADSAANFLGGTMNSEGVILFSDGGLLMQASATGGSPAVPKKIDQINPVFPHFLPDGKHFIFTTIGNVQGIHVGTLDSEKTQQILPVAGRPVYSPLGFILFVQQGRLMAQRFDAATLSTSGNPVKIADGIAERPGCGCSYFSASADGTIAYRPGTNEELVQMTWFDRTGKPVGQIGTPDTVVGLRLSPDGRRLALLKVATDGTGVDVWLMDDIQRGTSSRFTFNGGGVPTIAPAWSPDAKTVAFNRFKGGTYRKESVGNGPEKSFTPGWVSDWSGDGRYMIGIGQNPDTATDLQLISMSGEVTWLKMPLNQGQPRISPDSKWLAYASDESGQTEIYVQRFPTPDTRSLKVSSAGGFLPRWRGDSHELFYVAADGTVMSVTIAPGVDLRVDLPRTVFPLPGSIQPTINALELFDVAPDGQRFLYAPRSNAGNSSVSLILNWPSLLKP